MYVFGGAPEDKDVSFDHVYVLDLEVRMEWEKIMPALSDRIDCKLCRMGHTMTTITTRWSPEYEVGFAEKTPESSTVHPPSFCYSCS